MFMWQTKVHFSSKPAIYPFMCVIDTVVYNMAMCHIPKFV
jgi:hypothetical protein